MKNNQKMKDNQNTDKIDMSEINLRYREEDKKEKKVTDPKENTKKKTNLAPFATVLVFLLVALVVGLVYVTISNNKDLNKKLNDLSSKFSETEAIEETVETEKPTEKKDDKKFEESEKKEGRLIQDLNFRSSPSYDADVLGTIPAGTEVSGYIDQGWLKVEYKGQTGYIGPKYVE